MSLFFSVFTLKFKKKLELVTTLTRLFVIIKVKKCTPAEILFRYDSLAPGKARPRFRSKSLSPSDGCGSILCTWILSECAYHRALCRRGPSFFFFPSTANGGDVSPGVSTAEMSLFTAGFWQVFLDRLDAFNDALIDGFDRICFLSCFDWSFVANNYLLAHANRRDGSQDLAPYPAGWWA